MRITLLPPKIERWLLPRLINAAVTRWSKVFGGGNNSRYVNGSWAFSWEQESKTAFEAINRNVWLYASIYAIATSGAMLPFGVYKRSVSTKGGDYNIEEDDPLTQLFLNPNPFQTAEEFKEACFWSVELSGKLFIECVPDKKKPKEIYVLDPRPMEFKKDRQKFITGYLYNLDGEKIPFTTDQIIYHRYHNPSDPYQGLSAATPAGDAINGDISASEYNKQFFDNSAIPAGTLESDQRMNDDQVDALRMQWEKGHKGSRKAHRVAILWGGIKYKPMERSSKDMEFIKHRMLNREEILAACGVPPVMVGLLESAKYADAKVEKKLFWQQTMIPKLRFFSARMTKEFGLDGFKRKFMFDLSDVTDLQEDQEIRARVAFNLIKAQVMTPDDVRRIFYKLTPLPDKTGSQIWVPTNLVPANLQMNGPVAQPQATNKPGKPGGPEQQPGADGKKPGNTPNPGKKPTKDWDTEILVEAIDTTLDHLEKMENYSLNEKILVG